MIENEKRYRITRQRAIILETLSKFKTHPTADEIYERVKAKMPRISLGTVYRNLDFLCEQGLINKLELGGNIRRYECRDDCHYHVRCVECGKIEDIEYATDKPLEELIELDCSYRIIDHQLEFIGVCPVCQTPKTAKPDRKGNRSRSK
jgi:Fur family ferric uptake transcriptional regulator